MNATITDRAAGVLVLLTAALAIGGCQPTFNPVREIVDDSTTPQDLGIDPNAIPDAMPHPEPLSPKGNPRFYEQHGQRFSVLPSAAGYIEHGLATVYPTDAHGKDTANGEIYDMFQMTAGHRTLPIPTFVRITHLAQNRAITVRVNDRGPADARHLIRLSYMAAAKLGILHGEPVSVAVSAIDAGAIAAAPFGRDAAGAAQLPRARAINHTFLTTAPSAASPAPPAQPGASGIVYGQPPGRGFLVQFGAFSMPRNADNLAHRLQHVGFTPVYLAAGVSGGGKPIQRVQIGPFASRPDAERAVREARRHGFDAARIISP